MDSTTLLAQIAPQRSTKYANLAQTLAPIELQLSPLLDSLESLQPIELGDQFYLRCELTAPLTDRQKAELGTLAMCRGFFSLYETIGGVDGPFLQAVETAFEPAFPRELMTTRRYKGKTSDLFTHFMLNIARASTRFATLPWSQLRVFDPLAGGGSTLFAALVLGAEAMGIEQSKRSMDMTAAFAKQFMQEKRLSYDLKEERLRKQKAKRWLFQLNKGATRLTLARGEISQTSDLLGGVKRPHFVLSHLPLGNQHAGRLEDLLLEGVPIWAKRVLPGGAIVLSWDATRFSRLRMIELLEYSAELTVLNHAPYDQIVHRVDRVIKQRDVIVALTNHQSI